MLIERIRAESLRRHISSASSQHIPEACDGARKIEYEFGKGCTTAPMVSFSGPLGAQIDWSSGLYNLKQKPSFLLGLSITLQEFRRIVPTQWLL